MAGIYESTVTAAGETAVCQGQAQGREGRGDSGKTRVIKSSTKIVNRCSC